LEDELNKTSDYLLGVGVGVIDPLERESGCNGDYFPKTPTEIFNGVVLLKPYAIILLGLIILILTPVFRVGVSIYNL
jgi:uncharacterized membrane protein